MKAPYRPPSVERKLWTVTPINDIAAPEKKGELYAFLGEHLGMDPARISISRSAEKDSRQNKRHNPNFHGYDMHIIKGLFKRLTPHRIRLYVISGLPSMKQPLHYPSSIRRCNIF